MQLALRGGAVTGLVVVSLSLLGVGLLFLLFGGLDSPEAAREVPFHLSGSGLGYFWRYLPSGGIYTKAADVGADLVGKVEAAF